MLKNISNQDLYFFSSMCLGNVYQLSKQSTDPHRKYDWNIQINFEEQQQQQKNKKKKKKKKKKPIKTQKLKPEGPLLGGWKARIAGEHQQK
jgi:hypothetical protein